MSPRVSEAFADRDLRAGRRLASPPPERRLPARPWRWARLLARLVGERR